MVSSYNKKNITLLFRNKNEGISIQKVFNIIIPILSESNSIESYYMPNMGAKVKTVLQNLWHVLKNRENNRIYHITGAIHYLSFVLPPKRTITTVHDLHMLDIAESFSSIKRFIYHLLWCKSLSRNKYIVCISEKTKQDLLKYSNIPEHKIKIIGDPIVNEYTYSPKQFNHDIPRILHIGTKDNKNLDRTIKALKGLNVHLRIIGKLTPDLEHLLITSRIDYSNDYNISEEQIHKEYIDCDIVNFPSVYEGFGMPIIEAQAIGRVCLTSNLRPMNSVAGKGALFIDPYNIEDMREGYINLINDSSLRETIINFGLDNAKKYRAQKIAEEYDKLYQDII